MQPDKLEGRRCRKGKTQWRSCWKVDVVNCKGIARRRFVWYLCVHFFLTTQAPYLCPEDNPTPSQLRHCYLHLKKTNTTKNRKSLTQESNSPKTDSWPVNHRLTRLRRVLPLVYLLDFRLLPSINRFLVDHRLICLTRQPIDRHG
jgi:hypothetical protein